ncbi:Serine protease [Rhyzopertha dominica]|nr:Serine protease [Rhyzopertha dominica]
MLRVTVVLATLVACTLAAPNSQRFYFKAPRLDGRIVGGEDAEIEQFNYNAQLLYYNSHICGAVIISPQYVLTAAHCTDDLVPSEFSIRAGSSIRNAGGIVLPVGQIFQNPNYNPSTIDFDISILELVGELQFSESIGPIPLPAFEEPDPVGQLSLVTGWGSLEEGGGLPTQLQAVEVPVVAREECQEAYDVFWISERMLCAGFPEGGRDACQGDSGGPLVHDNELIGLVSWGYGCARPTYPGVYARVAALVDWISEITGVFPEEPPLDPEEPPQNPEEPPLDPEEPPQNPEEPPLDPEEPPQNPEEPPLDPEEPPQNPEEPPLDPEEPPQNPEEPPLDPEEPPQNPEEPPLDPEEPPQNPEEPPLDPEEPPQNPEEPPLDPEEPPQNPEEPPLDPEEPPQNPEEPPLDPEEPPQNPEEPPLDPEEPPQNPEEPPLDPEEPPQNPEEPPLDPEEPPQNPEEPPLDPEEPPLDPEQPPQNPEEPPLDPEEPPQNPEEPPQEELPPPLE